MRENSLWGNKVFQCPYCKALSTFSCIFSVKGNFRGQIYPFSVWGCQHCDRAIFIKHEKTGYDHVAKDQLIIEQIFPTNEPSASEHIPEGLACDFIEATKCYNFSAYKASAVLARRTIQKMCINLGADKQNKLYKQIDELKNSGKLHPDLADMATEVRFLGNDGAHPDDDGLDDINEEDAKEILDFTAELLDDLYVRPRKVEAMKIKRSSREQNENSVVE